MVGFDGRDPLSAPPPKDLSDALDPVELSDFRAVFSEDLGFATVSANVRDTFLDRVARIGDWFAPTDAAVPQTRTVDRTFATLRAESYLARYKELWAEKRDRLGPNIVENYRDALALTADDIAWAHAEQTRLFQAFQTFFAATDVLISPTVSVVPFPVEERTVWQIEGASMTSYFHWLALTYGLTLIGHPVISIPCGRVADGTPFGLQICGGRGKDRQLLEIAHTLMQRFAGDNALQQPRPPEDAISAPLRMAPPLQTG